MSRAFFDNLEFVKQTDCAVCGLRLGEPLINLPNLPITETLIKEAGQPTGFVDQEFHFCQSCGHGQLSNFILPKLLYGGDYAFRTSLSDASVKGNRYFTDFIDRVSAGKRFGTIVDIGCSDLHLLKSLADKTDRLVGIDPMLKSVTVDNESGKIECIADFFENVPIQSLIDKKKGTLFVSSHNLEHLERPIEVIGKIMSAADEHTVCAFQFPEFESLVSDLRFDQVIHHHLHYFSLTSFQALLSRVGGELLDHCYNRPFWGSLLVVFRKRNSDKASFKPLFNASQIRERFGLFRQMVESCSDFLERDAPERVIAYGAPLTLPALAYHLGYDFSKVDCVVDDDPSKDQLYYVSLDAQISNSERVGTLENSHVIVTALNGIRPILANLAKQNVRKVLVPLSAF